MIISSIDIQNGKVVQLKQGEELVLQRDNYLELADEFNRYGEVAVIDLDAAMNKGSNLDMIKAILRKAECRVGGGIRTPEQAKELVSLGARKIIIGSAAFRSGSAFSVNTSFLKAMSDKIGRERLIVAVDARSGEIVVDGWKTPTGLNLIEAAKAVEPYAGELLFTCVEREGGMSGIDLDPVRKLREAVSCLVTVAGGVSSPEELTLLASLGCDVQLGMALYTGKISLSDAFMTSLNWGKGFLKIGSREWGMGNREDSQPPLPTPHSLLPIIVQSTEGQVMMTGFTDKEALAETFKRGNVCFHSRTRGKLWMKGENSGNVLKLVKIRADCDRDALLATAEPAGPVCHTGAWSCFANNRDYTWEFLQSIITERFKNPRPGSYTATLDDVIVREKIMEEANEICTAKNKDEVIWEAADLLYFISVLMTRAGVTVGEVLDELDRRHKK
jgi:phosphoribosyl-ATP pyrophosphohydrolase/phosphoribosyl-AMP cyclohydrolase